MSKPNMANLFKQVQKMQEDLSKAQDELQDMKVEGSSGGGMVMVTANGKQEILGITSKKLRLAYQKLNDFNKELDQKIEQRTSELKASLEKVEESSTRSRPIHIVITIDPNFFSSF